MFDNIIKTLKSAESLTTLFAMLAAILAAYSAYLSYRLTKAMRDEMKSDELLISGVLFHPDLANSSHQNSVLQTVLFNKSKRKCAIHRIQVLDGKGNEIDVDWSDSIDTLGSVSNSAKLIGIVDSSAICVRRRDGELLHNVTIHLHHSFAGSPMVLSDFENES